MQLLTARLTAGDEDSARDILTNIVDMANCAAAAMQPYMDPLAEVACSGRGRGSTLFEGGGGG